MKRIFIRLRTRFSRVSVPLWFLLVLLWFGLGGCATGHYEAISHGPTATPEEAIRNAETYLWQRPDWQIDCSHFVLACYHSAAMDKFFAKFGYLGHNLTKDLRIYLEQHGKRRAHAADIQPGDILIFNMTYDKNHDGHIDEKDSDTHCALVENFGDMLVTYIDSSESRPAPRLRRRRFSFYDKGPNEHVAKDPATGRRIKARETFYAAYEMPKD